MTTYSYIISSYTPLVNGSTFAPRININSRYALVDIGFTSYYTFISELS